MALFLTGPFTVNEGALTDPYTVSTDSSLASGASLRFAIALGAVGDTALSTDYEALLSAIRNTFDAAAGIRVSNPSISSGQLFFEVANSTSSAIASFSPLLSFKIQTFADQLAEPQEEEFRVLLSSSTETILSGFGEVVTSIVDNAAGAVIRSSFTFANATASPGTGVTWFEYSRGGAANFGGIAGTEANQISVDTGLGGDDLVRLDDAIAFANLLTNDGNDSIDIIVSSSRDELTRPYVQFGHGAYKAEIRTGAGDDRINVQSRDNAGPGGYVRSTPQDSPAYDTPDYYDSLVDAGDGDDYVYGFLPYKTQFVGGSGTDTLFFYGRFKDWAVQAVDIQGNGLDLSDGSADYTIWGADTSISNTAIENSARGFEFFQFNDVKLDLGEALLLNESAAAVSESSTVSFAVVLDGDGLGSGQSVAFSLQLRAGSARVPADLAALALTLLKAGSLTSTNGIVLQDVELDAATGVIRAVASATSALAVGTTIASLSLPIVADLIVEPDEVFDVGLSGFIETQRVSITVTSPDVAAITLSGPSSVVEGATTGAYSVSLSGIGLGAGQSVTFTLDSSSGTATEGTDFSALVSSDLLPGTGITLSTSTAGGVITVTATNSSNQTIETGSTLLRFTIDTAGDLASEIVTDFNVSLASVSATVVGPDTVVTDIVDDDGPFIRILNYGRSVGNVTIEPGTEQVFVPQTLDEGFTADGLVYPTDAPEDLIGQFDFGLYYEFFRDVEFNENGTVKSIAGRFNFDSLGLKVPRYSPISYSDDSGQDDRLLAIGYPVGVLPGAYINALELTTIRMGGGDDFFGLIGAGIVQQLSADVSKEASQGYIFQSTIDAGDHDDYIRALMPFQSVFLGGDSTPYHDGINDVGGVGAPIVLSASLTLEELGLGDVIELKGSRYDWDIEFKDGADADTSVSLASILNGSGDYVVTSNNNQLSGFEVIRFGDLYFNLILARQQDSSAIFGQPDYYLIGAEKEAPELNSDIDQDSQLWEAFRFNRTKLKGIAGTATDLVDVFTGDAADTPYLVGALRFASLHTEAGDDFAFIGSADQAVVDLGSGQDQFEVAALFSRSTAMGGSGDDSLIFNEVKNGKLDAGDDDDIIEISTKILSSVVDGGNGFDEIILPGSFASYGLTPSSTSGVFNDTLGNIYSDFELIRFNDISLDVLQALSLTPPAAPIPEGEVATFEIKLAGSGLLAGESVSFKLQISNGSAANPANVPTDLDALAANFLQEASNIILSNVTVDAASGTIRAVASALTNVAADTSIATLAIPVSADLLSEPDETFAVTLTDFVQASTSTSTIVNVDPVTIRLRNANPLSVAVAEGGAARYAVALDQTPLAAGRSVSFSLSSDSGTATEGQDFTALSVAALDDAVGLSRSGVSVDAVTGAVTIILANNSGVSIAAGSDLITFDLPISTDASVELPESFSVTLVSTTANVSNAVVTTTIADLVPSPVLALVGSARVSEGQDARYSVNLAGGGLLPTQSVTFTLRTAETATGADADQDVDFPILPAQLTPANGVTLEEISTSIDGLLTISATNSDAVPFAVGRQLFSFTVPTAADVQVETDETFSVVLTQSAVPQVVTTTIVEDEVAPVIRLEGVTSVSEGTIARYAVYLDGVGLTAGQSVRLSLDSSPGTAAEVIDFLALAKDDLLGSSGVTLGEQVVDPVTGSIGVTATNSSGDFLAAGAQLLTFEIDVLSDSVLDADEAFSVLLGSSTASVSVSSLATTIANQLPGAGAGGSTSASAEPTPLPGGGLFITASAAKTGSQPLVGTAFDDVLTGGFGRDELDGGFGIDNLTGGPGSDLFKLRFGDRDADRVLDFSPGEDKIAIGGVSRGSRLGRALKGNSSSRNILKTVDNRKQAAASKSLYAYDSSTGALYYNANGKASGFGSGGGLVAELSPGLDLGGRDLTFDFL